MLKLEFLHGDDGSLSTTSSSRNSGSSQNTELQCSRLPKRTRIARHGFTILEVLIATAVTLLMMISLTLIFKAVGDSVTQGRAALELNNRLRNVVLQLDSDLQKLTAVPITGKSGDPGLAAGYFEYYDGPMTDMTALDVHAISGVSPVLSRFGDTDDILMFTAKANDRWFVGKVPQYILTGAAPSPGVNTNLVNITSQYAEIAIFAQPVVTNVGNPTRDPNFYLTTTPNGALAFQDNDNLDGSANGFPDGFNLHHRVLLIRPDLNLPSGNLPGGSGWTIATPSTAPVLPSPLCDMATAHGQCDLSIRRMFDPFDGLTGTTDFVAANSLADLVDPANRFAHVQLPLPGTTSTTMPLIALGQSLPLQGSQPDNTLGGTTFAIGTSFLHPAYTLRGARGGEDVLGTDLLAFDVKGFDPAVPLLAYVGADGAFGTVGVDEDGNGTTDDASEFGWKGSDDQILTPNDPGYGAAVAVSATATGTGEFVDLAWGRKTVVRMQAYGLAVPAAADLWTPLSCLDQSRFTSFGNLTDALAGAHSDGLLQSGMAVNTTAPALHVYQPRFDTWTERYESDGFLHASRSSRTGTAFISGQSFLYIDGTSTSDTSNASPTWRQTAIDAASDGIDNAGSSPGIDDATELETSPPINHRLSGIRAIIRMEDVSSRQVAQMSVGRELSQ